MPLSDSIFNFLGSIGLGSGSGNDPNLKKEYLGNYEMGKLPSIGDPNLVGYGTGNDAYTEGKTVMLPKTNITERQLLNPKPGEYVPQTVTKKNDTSANIQTNLDQAQAAARVNPLVALGFDPRKVQAAPVGSPTTVSGTYTPSSDLIWSNTYSPTATIHESVHRGLEQLRQAGMMPEEGKHVLGTASEEMIVRHIMEQNFGPVEEQYNKQLAQKYGPDEGGSTVGQKQIDTSRKIFSGDWGSTGSKGIDAIMQAAQDLYNQRKHKMGPN